MAIADNLTAYYKFDENTGTVVADSLAAANGTWSGSLGAQWTTGILNSGGLFNGSDNYVDCGDPSSVDFGTGDYTIAAWIFPTVIDNTTRMMVVSKDSDVASSRQFSLEVNGAAGTATVGALRMSLFSAATNVAYDTAPNVLTINTWNYAVGQRSGNVFKFYVNGVTTAGTKSTGSDLPQTMTATGANLHLGDRVFSSARDFFTGKIDEVGIWSRALSAAEVSALYKGGVGLQYPFPVGSGRRRRGYGI